MLTGITERRVYSDSQDGWPDYNFRRHELMVQNYRTNGRQPIAT
jgi:hypothetical protein